MVGFSRLSTFSRISKKWTFSEKISFPKDPLFRTRNGTWALNLASVSVLFSAVSPPSSEEIVTASQLAHPCMGICGTISLKRRARELFSPNTSLLGGIAWIAFVVGNQYHMSRFNKIPWLCFAPANQTFNQELVFAMVGTVS